MSEVGVVELVIEKGAAFISPCFSMKVPEDFQYGRVVIFGGSFDPITFTHIQVATEIINFDLADQVWIVPCGMRPDKHTNISPEERCEMVSIALEL
jgi:hypothetical protein